MTLISYTFKGSSPKFLILILFLVLTSVHVNIFSMMSLFSTDGSAISTQVTGFASSNPTVKRNTSTSKKKRCIFYGKETEILVK